MSFLRLDIANKFYFTPDGTLSPSDYQRADYTIKVLSLNRSELVQWRMQAFKNFIGWIDTYQRYKKANNLAQIADHQDQLRQYPHFAVWEEMQRVYRDRDLQRWEILKHKHDRLADLDALFTQSPELVDLKLS